MWVKNKKEALCVGAHSQYFVGVNFGYVQNYFEIKGSLKIVIFQDRKTPKR